MLQTHPSGIFFLLASGLKVGMGSSAENILISPGERQLAFSGSILHCHCLSVSFWLRQLLSESFTVTAVVALNVHLILHIKVAHCRKVLLLLFHLRLHLQLPHDPRQCFASWHLATYLNMEITGSHGVLFGRGFTSSRWAHHCWGVAHVESALCWLVLWRHATKCWIMGFRAQWLVVTKCVAFVFTLTCSEFEHVLIINGVGWGGSNMCVSCLCVY